MKVKVLGTQKVDYVSRKTGNPVVGLTLHVCFKDADTIGEAVDNIFVSDNLGLRHTLDKLTPNSFVDIEYNRRGYVADVSLVEDTSKSK